MMMKTSRSKPLLQIGEVAAQAGVTVRTVRYYLEKGFIQAKTRSEGGFYLFTPDAANTVFYVHKLRAAGLALQDIHRIYQARAQGLTGDQASAQVTLHLEEEKRLLEQKIRDYQELRAQIEEAIEVAGRCRGCTLRPTRETCLQCEVFQSLEKLPLPLQAIL